MGLKYADEAEQVAHQTDALRQEHEDTAPHEGCTCLLLQQVTTLRRERDEARKNYQFMVDRVADEKLDGYRELGARAAAAENQRDLLEKRISSALDMAGHRWSEWGDRALEVVRILEGK